MSYRLGQELSKARSCPPTYPRPIDTCSHNARHRSLYIIKEWVETLTETVTKLSGRVATPEELTRGLYLATRFHSVNAISSFEVYHAGEEVIVEADIVLPHSIALKVRLGSTLSLPLLLSLSSFDSSEMLTDFLNCLRTRFLLPFDRKPTI